MRQYLRCPKKHTHIRPKELTLSVPKDLYYYSGAIYNFLFLESRGGVGIIPETSSQRDAEFWNSHGLDTVYGSWIFSARPTVKVT